MTSGSIVVVGSSNTDMIVTTRNIPRPGETVLGGEFSMAAGGKGANQAVGAARAGGRVTLVARVGDDMFGEQAIRGFAADGIDVSYVIRDREAPSGVALIVVGGDGENSIAVASGANARLSPSDLEPAAEAIREAAILLMQLETPIETVEAASSLASASGVRIILNPAPARPLEDRLLEKISILTPNETEAEMLTGIRVEDEAGMERAAEALLARGVETVILTLGPRGVYIATAGSRELIPGFRVRAVDTTAAGDIFNGALAAALAEGRDLHQAVVYANAAAALSVMKLGAQPSAPGRREIEEFLAGRNEPATGTADGNRH